MEPLLAWGLGLLLLAAVLLVIEFFVPSGGVLGLTAIAVAIAGVVCLFRVDAMWGAIGTLTILVGAPAALYFGLKLWPHTAVGRRIIGMPSETEREARIQAESEERRKIAMLIGREGIVLTDLRPVGTVEVDGQRYDALSDIGFVRAGARVKVVGVDVAQLKVREIR
jgi:membrane-bound ClpP family serine protease